MGLGGAQSMVVDLVELHDARFSPTVISLRDSILPQYGSRLHSAGVPYRSMSLTHRSLMGPLRLRRALADGKYDVLHAHLDFSNSAGILAALSLPQPRPAIVSQIHLDPKFQNSAAFRATARTIAPYVDSHLVATASLGKKVNATLQHRARRVETIGLGVDIERFKKCQTRSTSASCLRGGANRVIGYIGRLAPQKNIESLLRSMPDMLRAEPSTRLLIVGDGPDKASLEAACHSLGISAAVTFTGCVKDVTPVYEAIDVLVLPSWHEGFGLVLVEAMAMEVPIVATESTGIIDVVENGKTALLVPCDASHDMSQAILKLYDDKSLRQRLTTSGRQAAESKYSRHQMTHRIEELYDDVLSNRGR